MTLRRTCAWTDTARLLFRSSWGYGPDHEWEDQDDPANDAGYSSEDSFTEEEDEV